MNQWDGLHVFLKKTNTKLSYPLSPTFEHHAPYMRVQRTRRKYQAFRVGTVFKSLIRPPSLVTARFIYHLQIPSRSGWVVVPSLLLTG